MQYLRMIIALSITMFLIFKVYKKSELIVPICGVHFFILALNDIFNAGKPLELANGFGVSYQISDMMLLIFAGVLIMDLVHYPVVLRTRANCFVFYIIVACGCSMILGFVEYGANSEWIADVRSFGLFIMSMLFFARFFEAKSYRKYMIFIEILMFVVLGVSIILWGLDIGFGIHPLASQVNATLSDGGSTMRFVQPQQVLVMAFYVLYLVRKSIRETQCISLKAMIYFAAVVLFQHRSVWLALGTGLIVIMYTECIRRKVSFKLSLQVIVLVIVMVGIVVTGTDDITENIRNGFELMDKMATGASLENTTAATRMDIWDAVRQDLSGIALLIGRPFGYGYGKDIGWDVSPHSGYIRILGRTGYVGLGILIILMVYIMVQIVMKKQSRDLEFIVCIMFFMFGYDFTWSCGVVIGCYMAMLVSEDKKRYKGHINEKKSCIS